MSKRVLITGGAGFIGTNLSLKLLSEGYQVWALDNLHPQIHGTNPKQTSSSFQFINNKVTFIKGDVTNKQDWKKVIGLVDSIIHLAAETGTGQSMTEIDNYSKVNIGGTSLMLDLLTKENHHVKKVVVASSRAVYGEGKYYSKKQAKFVFPQGRKVEDMESGNFEVKLPNCDDDLLPCKTDESSTLHPTSFYGISKQFQEQAIMTICPNLDIAPVSLRFQNVYGPGQSLNNPYTGVLSSFASQIMNGQNLNIYEDGKESRDFIFIDDVVNAIILALESSKANGHIFNVGTGIPISILEVAKKLKQLFRKEANLNISGDFRAGDIRHNYADVSKIEEILSFKVNVKIDDGLRRYVNWVTDTIPSFYNV